MDKLTEINKSLKDIEEVIEIGWFFYALDISVSI
jgi:hypothetical protein